jgi:hypothetical protein
MSTNTHRLALAPRDGFFVKDGLVPSRRSILKRATSAMIDRVRSSAHSQDAPDVAWPVKHTDGEERRTNLG